MAVTPKGEGDEGAGDVWKGKGDVMNDFVELRSIPAVVARPEKVEVRLFDMLVVVVVLCSAVWCRLEEIYRWERCKSAVLCQVQLMFDSTGRKV